MVAGTRCSLGVNALHHLPPPVPADTSDHGPQAKATPTGFVAGNPVPPLRQGPITKRCHKGRFGTVW